MNVYAFLKSVPLWALAAVAGFIAAAAVSAVFAVIHKKRIRRLIDDLEKSLESGVFPSDLYKDSFLLRHSSRIENFARQHGKEVLSLSGLDRIWLDRYRAKPDKKLMAKILEFIPEKGLFTCFLGVLEKNELSEPFLAFIGEEPGTLRKLPLSGSGEPFDSLEAKKFFASRLDEIREMAGDPEWPVRYFAVKILLTEDDERSIRGIEEAFKDPHPLIRKTVIEEASHLDRDALYSVLLEKMTDDPSHEVRHAAYGRIMRDFPDTYEVDYDSMDDVQVLHALDFLDPSRERDIDAAFKFLKSDNLEIRFPAAVFLEKHGYLAGLLAAADFTDTELMERNADLLEKASEVKVDGFLSEDMPSDAAVFMAMSILKKTGRREFISPIAGKYFERGIAETSRKVWESIVECISGRGDEAAVSVLMEEFKRRRDSEYLSSFILDRIPGGMEHKVYPYLFEAVLDAGFKSRQSLINAVVKLPPERVLPDLFGILNKGRSYPHEVRIMALKILAGFKLPYCLQVLIEQLPTLPVDEAREFSSLLSFYNGKLFNSRIIRILEQEDAKIRAAVIASLPETGIKEFLKPIKNALSDADPDVRIAAIWALADYGEGKVLGQAVEMLRDPVERVRVAAAEAIGAFASSEKLGTFMDIIKDPNEVMEVKKAVITGLARSDQKKSIDFLIRIMDEYEDLRESAVAALSKKTSKKDLKAVIENIKDASPSLRQYIMQALGKMGPSGEETIASLLEEDIASLKDQIIEILESSGYVEHKVRLLSHRDPGVRVSAAKFLSRLGSEAAFRGIVLAARDPEDEVRVQVARALEKLNSEEGKEILEKLRNDPDKRVRKFTYWALERIKSKAIED